MAIEIHEVVGNELHCHYRGQTEAQSCYVSLDAERGILSAAYNGEIGSAVPTRVHHAHVRRWSIPTLRESAANALLEEIRPLAERVCAGYESAWDGHNHVARFDGDAQAAMVEIETLCDRSGGEGDEVVAWDASEWLGGIGSRDAQRAALQITAATTDDELEATGARLEGEARCGGVDELDGLDRHLRDLRDEAREEDEVAREALDEDSCDSNPSYEHRAIHAMVRELE